ncbi:MAG: NosD domain-containing protein, partial [Candidatus Hodarchaeota archaeon]
VAHNYDYGISLEHSKYSTITHNTVANNHFKAISLANSGHSTLTQNNITNNMEGISLWESEHSTVANNTVSNGGIRILKSGNTTVVHNTVSNCEFGISIVSNTTIVAHNTVSNCGTGIWLSHSKYSTITNNTVSQNKYIGIRLSESGFNTIANNTISHNRDAGIKLHVSGNNTLLENRLINNGLVFDFYLSLGPLTRHGYRLMPVQHHIQATVAENVVNGRPLIYWQNVRGGTVPPGAGQVVLMNTTGVEVTGQDLTQANIGVFAAFSLHLDIHHNTLFNNTLFGIALEYSNHSTIAHNTLYNNSRYGISLESSKYSTIAHNTVTNGGGISLEQSGHSTVINNTVSNCGDGIHLWDSGNTTLANNTIHITPHRLSALTITYPNGGETLQGTVTLQWTPTNDSWEHSVTYTVSYSADDGHPWILLASGLSTSEYEWDTTTVADGFAYRIQVVATCSEGLMAVDVSNTPFIIQNSAATTTVGAFPNPGEPIGILLATLLLAMNAVRRGKRKSR